MKVMILIYDEDTHYQEVVERRFPLPTRYEALTLSGKQVDQLLKYLKKLTITKTKRRLKCENF